MEEVDRIILHSLRQINCDIDEEITSLKQFDSEMIVKAAVSCLDIIQPGLGLPKTLPYNMAAKYRVGQDIAQACTDIGYPGDIGYQTFLYSGETDLRKLLMFLTEKLPKEQEKFVHEPSGSELFMRKIRCKIKEELQKPWIPKISCCSNLSNFKFLSHTFINESPETVWREFWSNDLPSNDIEEKYLIPTILTINARGVLAEREPQWTEKKVNKNSSVEEPPQSNVKLSKEMIQGKRKPLIAPKPKIIQQVKESEENEQSQRLKEEEKEEEKEIEEEEEALTAELERLLDDIQQLQVRRNQIMQDIEKEDGVLQEKTQKDALRAQILKLLPDGENNVIKLGQIVEASAQRLVSFAGQWEKHRLPLFEKYRQTVQLNSSKKNEAVRKAETIKCLEEKRNELEAELKNKDKILLQLKGESEKNGKEVNRSAYTRRIMEIIGNIEKQKMEIDKVLKDTREVQKEINNLTGQLERSFTIADETIFRDAKKNETSRRAYKLLATLHSDCDQLVEMVQETGAIVREIRDLEDQIEKEKSKNIAANLERITADLNEMKAESAQLTAQLKLKQRGDGQGDSDNSGNAPEIGKEHPLLGQHVPTQPVQTKPRGKRRSLMSLKYPRQGEVNGESKGSENKANDSKEVEVKKENVKTERLSPTGANNANVHADNASNSSRSGTPSSSYPGTPPGTVTDSRELGSSPSNLSGQGSHLKQMEQMIMSRNYSDFMRSLAAKYNNANPNDYFSSSRNGFPQPLDPRFGQFKSGASTPFVGLMTPLGTSAVSPSSQQSTTTSSSPNELQKHGSKSQTDLYNQNFGLNGLNPFAGATVGNLNSLFPPMIDMSSTQALLNMVRTASAQNQAQLESYLKGAHVHSGRRPNESSPLDLSSTPVAKKVKKESGKDGLYDNLLALPLLDGLRTKDKVSTKNRSSSPTQKKNLQNSLNNLQNTISTLASPSRGSGPPRCASLCGSEGRSCADSDGQSIAHWSVEDVCSFVSSIDICAEYEKNFREERIDGTSLPLLTEEHLTNSLSMKLGPALKLKANIARRLGHCAICLHCVHCHGASSLGPGTGSGGTSSAGNRPSSTGN